MSRNGCQPEELDSIVKVSCNVNGYRHAKCHTLANGNFIILLTGLDRKGK